MSLVNHFFVPTPYIFENLLKLEVIYCVGGVIGPPCGVPSVVS
jgi:hypothetical protein